MSFQSETRKQLKEVIAGFPHFNSAEKEMWLSRADSLPVEYACFLLNLFEDSPDDIRFLTNNIERKEKIINSGDHVAGEELLEQEKSYLLALR